MAATRHIGRSNVAKRLRPLEGTRARTVYAGGRVTIELDESVLEITPPFGLDHEAEYEVVRGEPLLDALFVEPTVAVLLARIGSSASGVLEGERLVASKVETRFVKGRHRKGGRSSNRFRRRRGEQEREFVDDAAEEAARVLAPWEGRVDRVALGGDRTAVARVLAARPELAWLEPLALERFFDVPEPRLRVLQELPYQLYAAKVVETPRA